MTDTTTTTDAITFCAVTGFMSGLTIFHMPVRHYRCGLEQISPPKNIHGASMHTAKASRSGKLSANRFFVRIIDLGLQSRSPKPCGQ